MQRLLIIEDEESIRHMVRFALNESPYDLVEADTAGEGEALIHQQTPNLLLLDWMLPDTSGVSFLKKLRKNEAYRHIPVIMLTARALEENKIKALEAGADDYITKPFSPRELKARIEVVLRRGPLLLFQEVMTVGAIEVDTKSHEVKIDSKSVTLTPIEYKLLVHLMKHRKRVHSREQLITHIWGGDQYLDERTVDVQIKRLRKRLSPYRCDALIKTVRGFGYQFIEDETVNDG